MSLVTARGICLFFLLFSTSPAICHADSDSPTVYQTLEDYGFPAGILPKGITNYELDKSTGKFTVYLNNTCTFTISGYNLKYKTKVTGIISNQRLSKLDGVQVKVLFFWLSIDQVSVDGDELDFSVGIVSADFPLDNFYESPQCGCGFDCVNNAAAAIGEQGTNNTPKFVFGFGWKQISSLLLY